MVCISKDYLKQFRESVVINELKKILTNSGMTIVLRIDRIPIIIGTYYQIYYVTHKCGVNQVCTVGI